MSATATLDKPTTQERQPKGLYLLFFTEMWERFSYYGMRALLVLYLVSQFKLERAAALEIYAIFTGLVYVTPIIGGLLADKVLGQRKAIFIGAILMALGQFALAASTETFYLGLGLLCVGNGFFKPNISTIVGALYRENDPRRDGGFTIFYMGINLGAFFSPLVCGYLGEKVAWSYGFASAGVGMLLGTAIFLFGNHILNYAGMPPTVKDRNTLIAKDFIDIVVYVVVSAALVFGIIQFWTAISDSIRGIIKVIFAVSGVGFLIYTLATNTKGNDEWSRVAVIFILLFFNVFFWAGFEQAGGTFNLFASENTDRMIFGNEIPAAWFQSINAIFIFTIAPVFAAMWVSLNKIGKEPNVPLKFTLALALLGVGFLIMHLGDVSAKDGLVSPMWLVMVYLFHTLGELCLSPVGLSMITKLSPPRIVSLMMGMWFASIAFAQYMAGILEAVLHTFNLPLFPFLTGTSIIGSLCLLVLSPWLKKMMKGVA
jgi:POT family proton-dependent oligopeptide transporter